MESSGPERSVPPSSGPALVVLVVIDQFRYDYLERFDAHFVTGGFELLRREGVTFSNAKYLHATTDTCPGHAVIATGTPPSVNGIVANEWHDGERGHTVYCAADGPPRNLLVPTLGDLLKAETGGRARVVTIGGKQGSAALLGGHEGDAVYWMDRNGKFVASRHHRWRVPRWVRRFNDAHGAVMYADRTWQRLLPPGAYEASDDEPGESGGRAFDRMFPHRLGSDRETFEDAFRRSPFADELLARFVVEAVREERLGEDGVPDLLAVSFTAADAVGHRYGPDSHELQDVVVRLDRQLAGLFRFLDREVGLDRSTIVLTADHGVASLPEVTAKRTRHVEASRTPEEAVVEVATRVLDATYGPAENWIAFHDYPNLYLNEAELERRGIDVTEASARVSHSLRALHAIDGAYTRAQLAAASPSGRSFARPFQAILYSFHPERSGHVVYQVRPFHLIRDVGTNHGTPWDYDAHVPLEFLGVGFEPGVYDSAVNLIDVAPTIAAHLGISNESTAAMRGRNLLPILTRSRRDATPGVAESALAP